MNPQSDQVTVGSQVEVNLLDRAGNKERLSFVIVAEKEADFANGYLSENTPLARSVLGERAGTTIPYLQDDILAVEIVEVKQSGIKPPVDAAEKRDAMMKKTVREVENTNAIVFASSFSGKWGDYDPDSIPKENNPEESK